LLPERHQRGALRDAQEAIVAHLDEAFGQHMLQEAMDELFDHVLLPSGACVCWARLSLSNTFEKS
jgi:hypothetical protein